MRLRPLAALISAYFALGHTPPADPPPVDPPPAAGEDDLENLDLLGGDDPPPGGGNDPPPAGGADEPDLATQLATERAARTAADKAARESADRLAALERQRGAAPPPPSQEQAQFDAEEALLRNSATTELQRWQINADRTMRANTRAANATLQQSRELADRSDYERLCSLTSQAGKVAKKYAPRVEERLSEIRSQGGNLDRRVVLKMLIGDDIVEGKVQTTPKKKAAAPAADPPAQVPRGRPAPARGDVRRSAANDESSKRRARLENQII